MAGETTDEGKGGESSDGVDAVPQAELDQLVAQLREEEVQAEDARLNSLDSFQLWVAAHPALRQMQIVDSLKEIGPALLEVLKRLLGL